jgi:soluble P-type ATPase
MIKIDIPGSKEINIENLVLDYNGTIAYDGKVLPGVVEILQRIKSKVTLYVLTADTYGTVKKEFENTGIEVHILENDKGTLEKYEFVKHLGLDKTMSIGNGNNDALMLKESVLSIGIMGKEGCSPKVLMNADIIVTDILDALALVEDPIKIKATLRS